MLRSGDSRSAAAAKAIAEIFWGELMALRDSPKTADVIYALQQLNEMSEHLRRCRGTTDFHHPDVSAGFLR